ncbi:hypothetical protein BT69DRAFT_1282502 [Atractiella rhizophila]|nr:hypothetical protein BT69DRAFT_1282502 [Atractiella rhizophila]
MGRTMKRKMKRTTWMRRLTMRMVKAYDAIKSASSSQKMTALVHFITPLASSKRFDLSILPSFLSRLPASVHTLRISFILSHSLNRDWKPGVMSSKLWNLSLERVKIVVNKDGVINLCIAINGENVTVTFLKVEGHLSAVKRDLLYNGPYTRTFPLLRENAIFTPMASYSEHEERFIPISDDESSSLHTASIIQLSVPPPDILPRSISCLPMELLSLIFSFSDNASTVSSVSMLWRHVSAPYWDEPGLVVEKHERLQHYPGAGRLWDRLLLYENISVGMAQEVITGSPNAREVGVCAFWNDEEVKSVLDAIERLKRVDDISFRTWGSRKWRKEEIENFMQRMGDRIRRLEVLDVEDSPAAASEGLHLSSRLEHLDLYKYPPLLSLSLPSTLKCLKLSNICPLPSSISESLLPPLLHNLTLVLAPCSVTGRTSILPTPFDLSHLTRLNELILDGGEETSNVVFRKFFSTIKNAKAIRVITLKYCAVDSVDFPDFIHWFFGNWRVRGAEKGNLVDGKVIRSHLNVRSTMRKYKYESSEKSGVWEPGDK